MGFTFTAKSAIEQNNYGIRDSPSDVPTCIFTGVRNRQRVVIVESWQSAISSGPLEIAPGGFLWTRR